MQVPGQMREVRVGEALAFQIIGEVARAEAEVEKSTSSARMSVWAAKGGKTGQNGHPKSNPGEAHFVEGRHHVFLEVVQDRRVEAGRTRRLELCSGSRHVQKLGLLRAGLEVRLWREQHAAKVDAPSSSSRTSGK